MPGAPGPGGRLARLSRERAQPGAMIALGDGCFRATGVLPHHAAGSAPGLSHYPARRLHRGSPHVDELRPAAEHIDVGFFVSQCACRCSIAGGSASSWLRRLIGMAKRVAGIALAPPLMVLRVSVRECEQSF